MSDKKEAQFFEFQLKICSVKMKMKFPCRMALQCNKQPITKETPSTQLNKFFFNEIVVLRGEGDGYAFEILMSLYTEKGTKYTSGSMKLLSAQLRRSKGERLVIPLTKCLDPQAFCQLIVEGVTDLKDSQLKLSRSSSKVLNSSEKAELISPLPKKINSERFLIAQTRSQANFHPGMALGSQQKREIGPKSQVFKTFTKSPNSKFSNIKYATYNGNLLGGGIKSSQFPIQEGNSQRTSFDEGEVYRQGYLKLKQKFKKQTQLLKEQTRKKMALQANQNNLKLQIMKMRVKSEQQEKQITEKNQKIKILSSQLSEYQKKDLDLVYVKQECSSLERKNKMQEQTIVSLLADVDSIKKLMTERTQLDEKTILGLRQQIQLAKNKVSQLSCEFQLQSRAKENIILTKNNDIQLRNDTIERQKQLIKDFQQQAQTKLFDHEKTLNTERNFFQKRLDEQKIKVSSVEGEKNFVEQKNIQLQNEIQRLNGSNASLQFKIKILSEQLNQTGKQLSELKIIRDKYQELTKEHRFLQQQFQTVRKNLESTLQHKQINLTDLLAQYQQGKQRAQKNKTEQQDKIKFLTANIHQKEVEIDVLLNSLQKNKRINENLTKENQSLRQQNKLIRQDLKSTQRKLIGFQSQYSSFESNSTRQSTNLRTMLQKLKEQRINDEKKIDQLRQKNQKQTESLRQYEEKENQWKIKQRHYDQKIQKDSNKHKESSAKFESIIKNQENIINDNQSSFQNINNDNRALRRKINQLELIAIRDREMLQKSKKDLKLNEQKCSLVEQQLRNKTEDQKTIVQKILLLEQKIASRQQQILKLREKLIEETAKSAKQDQINQLVNKEKLKLQKQNEELTAMSKLKELAEQKLRQDLKNHKEEVVKEKMRTTKIDNDFEKFKENISDIIRIQFTRILNTPTTTQKNTQRLRESQISNAKSEKTHRSRVGLDAGNLSAKLMQKLHETKNSLWKMVELNKILKQQNTKLLSHTQNETNKYQFTQLQLHRDIQLLQDEMNNLMNDKQIQCQNYDQLVLDLNFRLKEKQAEVEDLRSQIAEYEAIVNGLKTDFQVNNDLNDKKVLALKQSASQLNERIEYLNLNVACLQDKNHQLQEKTIQQQTEIISYKEMLMKNQKILIDVKESEAKLTQSLELFKKELKNKQQAYVQLEMHLNSQKESKQKYAAMLQEEEKKCQKLNQFANTLIVQKQKAIKGQLQKSQQNNQLENQLFQLTHNKDLLQEENLTIKKKLDESREENKAFAKNIKILQKQLAEEKAKNIRSLQKVKQRESDLQIKRQYIKDLQQKYKQLREKNYKEIRQLSNQLQDKSLIAINASKQLNEKIIKVENESKKRWQEALILQSQVQNLSQQLYLEKDKAQDQGIEISRLKQEKLGLEEQIASRQFALQERVEELNKLEELVGQLRLQILNLEQQCNAQQKQFNHHVSQLQNDYNYKLQETAKENAHNQEILMKQNKKLKEQSEGLEQLLAKTMLDHNNQNADFQQKMSSYEERFKKIEAERLNTILIKNNEIKKNSDENKLHQQRLRQKEAEIRKSSLLIEQKKITQAQLQAKISHLTEQAKNKQKVLQKEIEGLKQKDKVSHESKQRVIAGLHQNQVQIRKMISQTLKKLVENCCKADTEKVLTAMKGLESSVAQAMMSKISKE